MSTMTEEAQRILAGLAAEQAAAEPESDSPNGESLPETSGTTAPAVADDVSAELARVYGENVKLAQIASDALIRAHEIDGLTEELDRLREAAGVSVEDVVTAAVEPIHARLGEIDAIVRAAVEPLQTRLDEIAVLTKRRRWFGGKS